MLLVLSLFFFIFWEAAADVYLTTFTNAPYVIRFIYNNDTITQSVVVFSGVNLATNVLTFQTVFSNSTSDTYLCRLVSQQRLVWGPSSCSDLGNPASALQSATCIPNEIDVQTRQAILATTWYLSKASSECFLNGGNGDIRLCMGPLRLARDNTDAYTPNQIITVKSLLASRYTFLDCLTGPMAMTPCIVEVQMEMPTITLTSNCTDPIAGMVYSGNYINIETDSYVDMITDVWKAFQGSNLNLRLLLKRSNTTSVNFRLVLANINAADGGYNFYFQSDVITNSDPTVFFINWIEQIQFGNVYPMYSYPSGTSSVCNLLLTVPSTFNYTLIPPTEVTALNYMFNVNPRRYNRRLWCSARHGRLTKDLVEYYADLPEGDVGGGDVTYVDPAFPNLPLYVPSNPFLHFRLDCDEFYPRAATFVDIVGIQHSRISIQQEHCFSPFLSNTLVTSNTQPNEDYTQCFKLGGYVWGRGRTLCARPITQVRCQKGWAEFNQNCYYKFNPVSETHASVVVDQADNVCAQLNAYAQPLIEIDEYLDIWLLNYFVFLQQNILNKAAYRIPQFQSSRCRCYDTLAYQVSSCDCYSLKFNGLYPIFPICFTSITQPALEPEYSDDGLTLPSATLITNGQTGPFQGGFEAVCKCRDGWCGKNCETPCCPLGDSTGALGTFFRKCYNQKRGSCFNGQTRVCQCMPFYGPSASVLPSLAQLFQFVDTPCACPAGALTSGSFQINGNVYQGNTLYVPCSGLNQGGCVVDNSTNTGYCVCQEKPDLEFGGTDPAYDGLSCSCPTPIQPWEADVKNGPIITQNCNNKGTCCPFGQTVANPIIGDLYASACYDQNGDGIQGCSCDNGWGGPSCTCPTPNDRGYERIVSLSSDKQFAYVNLGSQYFINFVRQSGCGSPDYIQITNQVGKQNVAVNCTFVFNIQLYVCGNDKANAGSLAYQYVALHNGIVSNECQIEAFETYFQYCGANETVSEFPARLFDNKYYRGLNINLEQQYVGVANFGCTNTDCACNSNFGGALCALAVSSIRPTTISRNNEEIEIDAKLYCGESVSVPILLNPDQGRGQANPLTGSCDCNAISNVDNTGKAGTVTESFTGRACQCANVYNEDLKTSSVCASNGVCIEPEFPYGRCSVDLETYQMDALYSPFIEKSSTQSQQTMMILDEDSYFISGVFLITPSPTKQPTNEPSKMPSKKPILGTLTYTDQFWAN